MSMDATGFGCASERSIASRMLSREAAEDGAKSTDGAGGGGRTAGGILAETDGKASEIPPPLLDRVDERSAIASRGRSFLEAPPPKSSRGVRLVLGNRFKMSGCASYSLNIDVLLRACGFEISAAFNALFSCSGTAESCGRVEAAADDDDALLGSTNAGTSPFALGIGGPHSPSVKLRRAPSVTGERFAEDCFASGELADVADAAEDQRRDSNNVWTVRMQTDKSAPRGSDV